MTGTETETARIARAEASRHALIPPEAIHLPDPKKRLNVRRAYSAASVTEMAKSLDDIGLIHPPTVVPTTRDQYQVVAGGRRVLAALQLGWTEIRCNVLPADVSRAVLMGLSLAENVCRRPLTDIETWQAFTKLHKAGRPVSAIAMAYDVSEKRVRQSLAIGGLPAAVMKLAGAGSFEDGVLQLLTTATPAQLNRFCALKRRPERNREIDEWLHGRGGPIPVGNALFDLDDYKGPIGEDLFSEGDQLLFFHDKFQFWMLQNAAIDELVEKEKDRGWSVERVDRHWNSWLFDRVKKADGGACFVKVNDLTGEVGIHKGFLRPGQKSTPSKSSTPKPKPELSSAAVDFMTSIRHVAMIDRLAANPAAGLALTVVQLIDDDWRCEPETFRSLGEAQRAALYVTGKHFYRLVDNIRDDVAGADPRDRSGNEPYFGRSFARGVLLNHLVLGHTRDELVHMVTVLTAERLSRFSVDISAALPRILGLKYIEDWTPTAPFWNSIRNKAVLAAIFEELAALCGGDAVDSYRPEKPTIKALREACAMLANSGAAGVADWRPRWLRFPASTYLDEHGLRGAFGMADDDAAPPAPKGSDKP